MNQVNSSVNLKESHKWLLKLKSDPDRFKERWIVLSKDYSHVALSGGVKKEKCPTLFYIQFKDHSFICSKGDEVWESDKKPEYF